MPAKFHRNISIIPPWIKFPRIRGKLSRCDKDFHPAKRIQLDDTSSRVAARIIDRVIDGRAVVSCCVLSRYDNRRGSRYSYIPQWASFIHLSSYFLFSSFPEAECCVGEATGEACWEPCYCVLLQDEQTLTAYRSEDMAVSTLSPSILFAWSWKPSPIRPDQPIGFLPSLLCYANFLEIFADYNFFFFVKIENLMKTNYSRACFLYRYTF